LYIFGKNIQLKLKIKKSKNPEAIGTEEKVLLLMLKVGQFLHVFDLKEPAYSSMRIAVVVRRAFPPPKIERVFLPPLTQGEPENKWHL
jgi:hypothetical protein